MSHLLPGYIRHLLPGLLPCSTEHAPGVHSQCHPVPQHVPPTRAARWRSHLRHPYDLHGQLSGGCHHNDLLGGPTEGRRQPLSQVLWALQERLLQQRHFDICAALGAFQGMPQARLVQLKLHSKHAATSTGPQAQGHKHSTTSAAPQAQQAQCHKRSATQAQRPTCTVPACPAVLRVVADHSASARATARVRAGSR